MAGFRFEHLGPCGDPHIVTAGDLPVIHYPSDGGPPCRLRDLQLFRSWAEQRRVGPQPGVELAFGLFNHPPDPEPFGNYARTVWRESVHGERGMFEGVCQLVILIGDACIAGRLSVAHTEDLIWFLARATLTIAWMDADRAEREDTTVVLPVMPLCLEVTKLATWCISLGKGLPTTVGETLTNGIMAAAKEIRRDHGPSLYCDFGEWKDPDVPESDGYHPITLF